MRIITLFFVSFLLVGCESFSYYSHVSKGQLDMLWERQDIEALLNSDDITPELKKQLQTIKSIRQYSIDVLKLPNNGSYLSYSDLGRPYAVWNVFAAEAFDTAPKQWCFLITGCVSYRGYFDVSRAEQYAQQLQQQGYDVYVAGVPAYSTLGWFDDPALNTFVDWQDWRLAALIFHELAHQQLYLAGDTEFSESFAKALEVQAVRQWLADTGSLEQLAAYQRYNAMQADFSQGLLALRKTLGHSYKQLLTNAQKQEKKQQLIAEYQQETYSLFKIKWQTNAYDNWVKTKLNNAKLLTVSSYYQWQPAFEKLYLKTPHDWPAFYSRAYELSKLPKDQRQQQLKQLH